MANKINIGTEIDLQDLLTSRMLIQANSGGGKSVTARVLMEEAAGIVPFIVMDVDGEYYTLKEKFGDVLVIGGQYADVPISLKSVKLLPKEIIGSRLSVVLDLSDLKMNERILYAKYFLETMMDLPKQYWVNYLVFIEEAHKLCGEQDKQESATAVKDLMSRGRKMGYCGILITQRISKLHKDAAAECNNKFVGRTFLDIDMDRSARELGFSSQKDKLLLRDLKPGHFYAFGTAITPHHVHEVTINQPKTKIPKAGSSLEIKPQKPTDKIKSVLAKLADLPGEAARELKTIQDLQAEVGRLKSELNKAAKSQPVDQVWVKELKQEIVNRERKISEKDYEIVRLHKAIEIYEKRNSNVGQILRELGDRMDDSHTAAEKKLPDISKKFPKNETIVQKTGTIVRKSETNRPISGTLPIGELKVLTACAQYPDGLRRDQLTVLTGYKRSSRDAYIQRAKEKGLLSQNGEKILATEEGIDQLGSDFEPLPTGEELQQYWISKLPQGEKAILEVLIEAYPESVTRETLSDKTGYMRSSRDAYVQRMSAKELVEIVGRGEVKASKNLFD